MRGVEPALHGAVLERFGGTAAPDRVPFVDAASDESDRGQAKLQVEAGEERAEGGFAAAAAGDGVYPPIDQEKWATIALAQYLPGSAVG